MVDDAPPEYVVSFAVRVQDLVRTMGEISVSTVQAEFDFVIRAEPRDPVVSLAFNVLLNEDHIIVESPQLGWWTFEWDVADAAWQVVEQIIARGGIVYRRRGWTGVSELRDLDEHLISGQHHNGGSRLRARRAVYLPYA